MAKQNKSLSSSHIHTVKKTTIGNGIHSRPSRNKSNTKKAYRGQGK